MDNITNTIEILYQSETGQIFKYQMRQVNLDDIPTIVQMRYQMFLDMGFKADKFPANILDIWKNYFFTHIGDNSYIGWLVVYFEDSKDEMIPIAGGGLVLDDHPPGPYNLNGKIGYIMNLITLPEHRNRGIALKLMKFILDWLRTRNINLASLHASEMGKKMYEKLGFKSSNEMKLQLLP
jgi:GNAT superfamily N-acetyltransferase